MSIDGTEERTAYNDECSAREDARLAADEARADQPAIVYQFSANDCETHVLPRQQAMALAKHLSRNYAAQERITKRIVVKDDEGVIVYEWEPPKVVMSAEPEERTSESWV